MEITPDDLEDLKETTIQVRDEVQKALESFKELDAKNAVSILFSLAMQIVYENAPSEEEAEDFIDKNILIYKMGNRQINKKRWENNGNSD